MLPLILSIIICQSTSDTILVKGTRNISYRVYVNNNKLCFQYQAGRDWSESIKLDSGDITEYAVAISPGDYIHIAYCKNQRVCYRTTFEPITKESIKQNKKLPWSTWVFVSTYFTEPAYNISIGTEGEYLYVIWQTTAEDNPKVAETWERKKLVHEQPYRWFTSVCLNKPEL